MNPLAPKSILQYKIISVGIWAKFRPHLAQLTGLIYSVGEDRFVGLASPVLSRVSACAAERRSVTYLPHPLTRVSGSFLD